MRSTTRNLLLLLAAGGLSVNVLAADIRVIANPSVTTSEISPEDLKSVFLETRTALPDGSHVEPVLLKSGSAHETFVRRYIGKSAPALEIYYRSLVFTGKALMPKTATSEQQLVEYVARTKGAVGYVSTSAAVAGVKTIEVK
jgi:ABC-type phosphate transport system substrate-binding protein